MTNSSRIFLDSGDPHETKETLSALGYLDGQTTNPSLVAKHPTVARCRADGVQCSEEMVLSYYREIIQEIHALIPDGAISIEVYADKDTTAEKMIEEARQFMQWMPDPYIKLPITHEGLKAAAVLSGEGVRLNMTLCFTQEQAVAVHAATVGADTGAVLISPFIGRLEDRGERGMDLVENIVRQYRDIRSHVHVLAASIRTVEHVHSSIESGAHAVTAPLTVLKSYAEERRGSETKEELSRIPFQKVNYDREWKEYSIDHPLTAKGLQQFADDWNELIR